MRLTAHGSRPCQDWCMFVRSKPPRRVRHSSRRTPPMSTGKTHADLPSTVETPAKRRRCACAKTASAHAQNAGSRRAAARGRWLSVLPGAPLFFSEGGSEVQRPRSVIAPRPATRFWLRTSRRAGLAPRWHGHCDNRSSIHWPRARAGASFRSPLRKRRPVRLGAALAPRPGAPPSRSPALRGAVLS